MEDLIKMDDFWGYHYFLEISIYRLIFFVCVFVFGFGWAAGAESNPPPLAGELSIWDSSRGSYLERKDYPPT